MDSLTQIVLGAAVGEVVLGRKVGNKAILWGAIAGTIPDLDVLARSLFDPLRANELHRGITHSIVFSAAMAPVLGWWVKRHAASLFGVFLFLVALTFVQGASSPLSGVIILAFFAVPIVWALRSMPRTDNATTREWSWLFWWSLVTHPLLDCHTTWGTQLFWPLPLRIAYNNIFVVDPLYTLPFLACVLWAMRYVRTDPRRRRINGLGIAISSTYMALTIVFKLIATNNIENSLARQEISYTELSTRPTPFNSILWSANVDAGDHYLLGYYSLMDHRPEVTFVQVDKDTALLGRWALNDKVLRLERLSQGNYVVRQRKDTLVFSDLRFGQMGDPSPDKPFVFSYLLTPVGEDLRVDLIPPGEGTNEDMGELLHGLWDRMLGQ